MKKYFFSTILIIAMIFSFVSCSNDVAPTNKIGKITIGKGASKAIGTVVSYSDNVEDVYWYYSATKLDDGYTTGVTDGFVPVFDATTIEASDKGLSGKILNSDGFSYGLWKIELKGYASTEDVENGAQVSGDTHKPKYTASVENFLVSSDMNYATVTIEVADGATTTIEFGDIWFSASNIKADSVLTLAVTDGTNTITVDDTAYTSGEFTTGKKVEAGKVTFKGITFSGTEIGSHEMKFVLSHELSGTNNTTIEAALYTLKFDAVAGTKTTISGDMVKNDQTGDIQINGVQNVPATTFNKVIPVVNDGSTTLTEASAKVKTTTTITVGDLKVTYPADAIIVPGTNGLADDKNTADAKVGFEYVDTSAPNSVTISTDKTSAKYDLTLSAATGSTNNKLLTVEKFIGKNLVVVDIYHESAKLANAKSTDANNPVEYYEYDSNTGVLSLHVLHASNFYVITKNYNEYVARIGEKQYASLDAAVKAVTSGDTIVLLKDITVTNDDVVGYQDYWNATQKAIVTKLNGVNFDGDNHTITASINDDGTIFGDVRNAEIKNLKVNFNTAKDTNIIYYTENATLTNIEASGNLTWSTGNNGVFVVYPRYDLTLDNCVNKATIVTSSGDTTEYVAVFLGYGFPSDNTYTLKNCSHEGSLTAGAAGLLIANYSYGSPAGVYHITFDILNTYNNGTITSASSDGDNNMITSLTRVNEKDYAVEIKIDNQTYTKSTDTKWYSSDILNKVTGTNGQFIKATDSNLSLTLNSDNTFTITPSQNANVAKYVVSVGTYLGTPTGSTRYYVTETILKDDVSDKTTIQKLSFVDKEWKASNSSAGEGTLCNNKTYALDDNTYYYVERDDCYTNYEHSPRTPEMISVSALTANGALVASYQLIIPQ